MPRRPKLTHAEKKTALISRVEALVDQILDWEEGHSRPNLTQIEDQALSLRQRFGQALTESVIAGQENVVPLHLPACAQCSKPIRPKGAKRKIVISRVGELGLERSHFYCPRCERGFLPLDEQLGVHDAHCRHRWPRMRCGYTDMLRARSPHRC